MNIKYVPHGDLDDQVFKLALRFKESTYMYSLLVDQQVFSSLHLELKDLGKVLMSEDLGVPGLTSIVNYTEDLQKKIAVIEFELTYQRASKTKRATENYRLEAHRTKRDMQLGLIIKLEAENKKLQRENESMAKQIRTMKNFGFEPYFNKDIKYMSISKRIGPVVTNLGAFYQSGQIHIGHGIYNIQPRRMKSTHYVDYDSKENVTFYNFLMHHPRFKHYHSWVWRERLPNNPQSPDIGRPTFGSSVPEREARPVRLHFEDPSDKVDYLEGQNAVFASSFQTLQNQEWMQLLFQDNPNLSAERNMINRRQNEFFCALFDVINEYNFKGLLLLPGGKCMPHPTNPDHVNEFFTERYCKDLPTPADKMFFNPCVGFYKCELYEY